VNPFFTGLKRVQCLVYNSSSRDGIATEKPELREEFEGEDVQAEEKLGEDEESFVAWGDLDGLG
jgi:hypothetical protein